MGIDKFLSVYKYIYLLANKFYINACIQYYFIFLISRLITF